MEINRLSTEKARLETTVADTWMKVIEPKANNNATTPMATPITTTTSITTAPRLLPLQISLNLNPNLNLNLNLIYQYHILRYSRSREEREGG